MSKEELVGSKVFRDTPEGRYQGIIRSVRYNQIQVDCWLLKGKVYISAEYDLSEWTLI